LWFTLAALALAIAPPPAAPEAAPAEAAAPAAVAQVYLVRHGQAFSNLSPQPKLTAEQLDRLTPLGHEQAGETGRALAARKPALILTSPAGRARESADEIRQALGTTPVRVEPRVRPQADDESDEAVGARVLEALRAESARHRGQAIVVVAHSEVIGALLGLARREPADAPPGAPSMSAVRNGSVSLVEFGTDGKPDLVFANRLPDELPPP
jgi:broad specificity phosphatase PhoE